MKNFLIFIYLITGALLVYNMPQILWNISYDNLINMLTNDAMQSLSELAQLLGLTGQTIRQYAIEKLAICGATGIYFFIAAWFTALIPTTKK